MDAVGAGGDLLFIAGPVFVADFLGIELLDESGYGWYGKAEVVVFIFLAWYAGTADDMELGTAADVEPGMAVVVEGFGYTVEADNLAVEACAGFEVIDIDGDMVDTGPGLRVGGRVVGA